MVWAFTVIFFIIRFSLERGMSEYGLYCWSITFFYSKAIYMGMRFLDYLMEILSTNTRVLQQCINSESGLSLRNIFLCNVFVRVGPS